jgi:hypothetical protein
VPQSVIGQSAEELVIGRASDSTDLDKRRQFQKTESS